jgi:4-diphosphocytidyl-2-C-methyl-D-erythritol kinase
VRRRDDGLHELRSLMVTLDLCDLVTLVPGEHGLRITGPFATAPEGNLATRALKRIEGVSGKTLDRGIRLDKAIPLGAGLGGGSADAAAVLRAAPALGADVSPGVLAEIAMELGADVPYQLSGGPALVMGAGESVLQLRPRTLHCAVCWPEIHCSTSEVFAALAPEDMSSGEAIESATDEWNRPGSGVDFLAELPNGLLPAALRRYPELVAARDALTAAGWTPRLTGSGGAMFQLCAGPEEAARLAAAATGVGWPAWACRTVPASFAARHA